MVNRYTLGTSYGVGLNLFRNISAVGSSDMLMVRRKTKGNRVGELGFTTIVGRWLETILVGLVRPGERRFNTAL